MHTMQNLWNRWRYWVITAAFNCIVLWTTRDSLTKNATSAPGQGKHLYFGPQRGRMEVKIYGGYQGVIVWNGLPYFYASTPDVQQSIRIQVLIGSTLHHWDQPGVIRQSTYRPSQPLISKGHHIRFPPKHHNEPWSIIDKTKYKTIECDLAKFWKQFCMRIGPDLDKLWVFWCFRILI